MDKKIGRFFDSVGSFFSGADVIPWCDQDIIVALEKEVAIGGSGVSEDAKKESIMRLSWGLVHSKRPEDVQWGIAMLEFMFNTYSLSASLNSSSSPMEKREKLYLLAVGHYRSGDYSRSRQLVERCLETAPDWRQGLTLKKVIEDKIAKDGLIGIGIAATAVGLLAAGIAAAVSRKK
ncbi:hypothetical protein MRB53_001796 [Persea americana]|uniref:Uncharacterized protein n=1 Tax=Persea americana TaxID=3435 RepID=A0ACC2MT15_PERAE|nr:hypothetical protein MRB53_001796 [Persea americana]